MSANDPKEAAAPAVKMFDPALVTTATVLIVDDESMITDSLRHFFKLRLSIDNVVPFNNPAAAVEWVRSNRIDMVVTDFLMPGMDGLELLRQVKEVHPEATRILLTGYADKANAIRAINEVGLFQYIEKPWDTERLANVVQSGLEHMALQRTLREMIEKLNLEQEARETMKRALIRAFA